MRLKPRQTANRGVALLVLALGVYFGGLVVLSSLTNDWERVESQEDQLFWAATAVLVLLTLQAGLLRSSSRTGAAQASSVGVNAQWLDRRDYLYLAALSIILGFSFLPLGNDLAHLSFFRVDVVRYYGYHYYIRDCLLTYGELPLRTPYGNGGFPLAGHPEFTWPNPCFLFSLVLGEALGLKVWWFALEYLQGLGMFLWLRLRMQYRFASACAGSLALAFSPWVPRTLTDGNFYAAPYAFTALFLFLLFGAKNAFGSKLLLGIMIVALSFDCYYYLAAVVVFLVMVSLVHIPRVDSRSLRGDFSLLTGLVISLAIALPLGMLKYLPLADFMHLPGLHLRLFVEPEDDMVGREPRYDPSYIEGFHGAELLRQLTSKTGYLGLGITVVLGAVVGWLADRRRSLGWMWCFWLCAVIAMAINSPLDLFQWLWRYGVFFKNMRHPDSYFEYFLVFLLILSFTTLLERLLERTRFRKAAWIIAASALLPLIVRHQSVLTAYAQRLSPVRLHTARYDIPDGFYQIDYQGTHRGREYPVIRKHIGMLDWYSAFLIPSPVEPRYTATNESFTINPRYRGEAYFSRPENKVDTVTVTPNRIRLQVRARVPDVLTINQNYHRYWRCDTKRVINAEGLLALNLPAGEAGEIELRYEDSAFRLGLFCSLTALLALTGYWFRRLRCESATT